MAANTFDPASPPTGRSWIWYRAQIASAKARDPEADVTALQRLYREARLAVMIEAELDKAPALTREQTARLATLFTTRKRQRLAS